MPANSLAYLGAMTSASAGYPVRYNLVGAKPLPGPMLTNNL